MGEFIESRRSLEHISLAACKTELITPGSEKIEICKDIEKTVFYERFGNTPEQMEEEYSIYEPYSTFILAYDPISDMPAGCVRLIENSAVGLKSLNDLMEEPPKGWGLSQTELSEALERAGLTDLDTILDHATTAVLREFRKSQSVSALVHLSLQASFFKMATQTQRRHFVAIFDDIPWSNLVKLGIDIQRIADLPSMEYIGSASSTPVYGDLQHLIDNLKSANPWLYDFIVANEWLNYDPTA